MAVLPRTPPARIPGTLEDARLVEMARDGDTRAFELLVARHRRRLLARVRRVLPADRAEDALQNGLLSAWLALQRGTEVREPRAWLEQIAHRAALRAIPERIDAELSDVPDEHRDGDPAVALERREELEDALAALEALPQRQREALLQIALEGESYEMAAHVLGIEQGALRGLVYRARSTIRGALGALMPVPALGRLLPARSAGARRAVAAVHRGASAGQGVLSPAMARGAAVAVLAAGGFGAVHLVSGGAAGTAPPAGALAARAAVAHGAPARSRALGSPAGSPHAAVRHRRRRGAARRAHITHRAADPWRLTRAPRAVGSVAGGAAAAAPAPSPPPGAATVSGPAASAVPAGSGAAPGAGSSHTSQGRAPASGAASASPPAAATSPPSASPDGGSDTAASSGGGPSAGTDTSTSTDAGSTTTPGTSTSPSPATSTSTETSPAATSSGSGSGGS